MSAGTKSQELVLAQVHPLNDVPTIVKYSLDVLSIDGACKVRITIVLTVSAGCAYTLQTVEWKIYCSPNKVVHKYLTRYTYKKFVSNEVLGPHNVRRFRRIWHYSRFRRCLISRKIWKIIF